MDNTFSVERIKRKILGYLKKLDYLLINEKDLQIYLAIKLKKQGYQVYTEYHLPKHFNQAFDVDYQLWSTERPSIDLVLESDGKFIAIELKYKHKELKGELSRFGSEPQKDFPLAPNQYAQNNARYDFWKDVKRLELIKKHYNTIGGIALFLTNDESYQKINTGCEYAEFGLEQNKKGGPLCWGDKELAESGKEERGEEDGTTNRARPNFELENSYIGEWEKNIKILGENIFHVYSVVVS